jgi:hypothetical protein
MATALPMMQLKSSIIHVEEVSDIDGIYTSSYKYATKCPSSITVKGTTLSPDKKVASTLVSGIVINGDVCTGGTMSSVTEDVARDKLALDALGFSGVSSAFNKTGLRALQLRVVLTKRLHSSLGMTFREHAVTRLMVSTPFTSHSKRHLAK